MCHFPGCLDDVSRCTCYPPSMSADVRAIARDVVPVTCPERARICATLANEALETARRIRHNV